SLRACAAQAPRPGNTATREYGFPARQSCARSATLPWCSCSGCESETARPHVSVRLDHFQRAVRFNSLMPVTARPACDKAAAFPACVVRKAQDALCSHLVVKVTPVDVRKEKTTMNRRQFLYASAASFACVGNVCAATYDLVIKGGRVIDPSIGLDAVRD